MCTNRCDWSVNGFHPNLLAADYLNSNTTIRTRFIKRKRGGSMVEHSTPMEDVNDINNSCNQKLINLFNKVVTLPLPNTMQLV